MKLIKMMNTLTQERSRFVTATIVDKIGEGPMPLAGRILVVADGRRKGTVGGGALEEIVVDYAKDLLEKRQHDFVMYNLNQNVVKENMQNVPMICGGEVKVFFEYHEPFPKLIIFGAGNVGGALITIMIDSEFEVAIYDPVLKNNDENQIRNDILEAENIDFFDNLDSAIHAIDEESYVVISTGSHEVDYEIIKSITLNGVKPRYMGMLASLGKFSKVSERLKAETGRLPEDIYSPIGLDIGGDTPTEIAISIAAQLIAKRNNKERLQDMRDRGKE